MSSIGERLETDRQWPIPKTWPWPRHLEKSWRLSSHERLDWAFQLSPHLYIHDESRLVFFSDCHRGNNGRTDLFRPNKHLFLHALTEYYAAGYTYVEVGDGDELWQNRKFTTVYQAHREVYDLLHRFQGQGSLYLLIGNHDSQKGLFDPLEKDGLVVHQGLVLHHTPSGQQLFVTHGHQAAPTADRFWALSRLNARTLWKWTQAMGFVHWQHINAPIPDLPEKHHLSEIPRWISDRFLRPARNVETILRAWATARRQPILCGHTHLAACPKPGEVPYFNTGSCINPGFITGIELHKGMVHLVKWSVKNGRFHHTVLRSVPITTLSPTSTIQEKTYELLP